MSEHIMSDRMPDGMSRVMSARMLVQVPERQNVRQNAR